MTQSLVEILETMSGSVAQQQQQQQQQQPRPGGQEDEGLLATAKRALLPLLPLLLLDEGAPLAAGDTRRTETAIAARGDSVATMADLEAGRAAALQPGGGGDEPAAVVPVQHVRRLTATLVDILRHVTQASGGSQQQRDGARQGQVGGGNAEVRAG
jgi:hypothetical protein